MCNGNERQELLSVTVGQTLELRYTDHTIVTKCPLLATVLMTYMCSLVFNSGGMYVPVYFTCVLIHWTVTYMIYISTIHTV